MTAMDVLHKLFSEEFEAERQRGFNEAYAEGCAEGLNEGIVKGRNEAFKTIIKQLISIGWSPEQAADFVNNN